MQGHQDRELLTFRATILHLLAESLGLGLPVANVEQCGAPPPLLFF
jgi:hypothetical protein